jgi:hypothetical protein
MEGLIHISLGGPVQKISVRGKIYTFEWHPYCGPIALKRNGDEARSQPVHFLEAASLWHQQGKRIENDLCVYDVPGEPISQHIVGRQYKIVGHHPDKRGS